MKTNYGYQRIYVFPSQKQYYIQYPEPLWSNSYKKDRGYRCPWGLGYFCDLVQRALVKMHPAKPFLFYQPFKKVKVGYC